MPSEALIGGAGAGPAAVKDVTEATFMAEVIDGSFEAPVIVDFWAPWCGPCRMVAPEVAKVASRNAGRYLVLKVNTDALPDVGERFGIRSIPTMAVFVNGREAGRTSRALRENCSRRPVGDAEDRFIATPAPRFAQRSGYKIRRL